MHHMFRQHGRAELEVDLSGCPITEETLLSNLDRSASASAPPEDIRASRSAASNETGIEAAAAALSSSAADAEAGVLESPHLDFAAAQHADEDGSEAARSEWVPDEDAGHEPGGMQEPIDWLKSNPLVWLWLLITVLREQYASRSANTLCPVQTHESMGLSLSLLPLCRGFLQRGKFTLYKTAAAYTAVCSCVFDKD